MRRKTSCLSTTTVTGLLVGLALSTQAKAATLWFNETGDIGGYQSFADLAAEYSLFMGTPDGTISFDDLPIGTQVVGQYADSAGVTLRNSAVGRYQSFGGVQPEGGSIVEDLTGYDGSYMPDRNQVYVKFDNHLPDSPLTVQFDAPVSGVGAFLAMGVQGSVHGVDVALYDASNGLIDRRSVESWLWETQSRQQNYETFFAVHADGPVISRVEFRNLSSVDFANALVIDNIAWSTALSPELGTGVVLLTGAVLIMLGRGQRR